MKILYRLFITISYHYLHIVNQIMPPPQIFKFFLSLSAFSKGVGLAQNPHQSLSLKLHKFLNIFLKNLSIFIKNLKIGFKISIFSLKIVALSQNFLKNRKNYSIISYKSQNFLRIRKIFLKNRKNFSISQYFSQKSNFFH